jgi:hypothetical protein
MVVTCKISEGSSDAALGDRTIVESREISVMAHGILARRMLALHDVSPSWSI